MAFKYEKLPNFCYWCGLVSHDEKDCEHWLSSKGTLPIESQEFGAWLRASISILVRRMVIGVVIVEGSGEEIHGVSPWTLVAGVVTVSSMDTEQGTVVPLNQEFHKFSNEDATIATQTATLFSDEKSPDLVGINHSLKTSEDIPSNTQFLTLEISLSSPKSFEAEILQIDAELKNFD